MSRYLFIGSLLSLGIVTNTFEFDLKSPHSVSKSSTSSSHSQNKSNAFSIYGSSHSSPHSTSVTHGRNQFRSRLSNEDKETTFPFGYTSFITSKNNDRSSQHLQKEYFNSEYISVSSKNFSFANTYYHPEEANSISHSPQPFLLNHSENNQPSSNSNKKVYSDSLDKDDQTKMIVIQPVPILNQPDTVPDQGNNIVYAAIPPAPPAPPVLGLMSIKSGNALSGSKRTPSRSENTQLRLSITSEQLTRTREGLKSTLQQTIQLTSKPTYSDLEQIREGLRKLNPVQSNNQKVDHRQNNIASEINPLASAASDPISIERVRNDKIRFSNSIQQADKSGQLDVKPDNTTNIVEQESVANIQSVSIPEQPHVMAIPLEAQKMNDTQNDTDSGTILPAPELVINPLNHSETSLLDSIPLRSDQDQTDIHVIKSDNINNKQSPIIDSQLSPVQDQPKTDKVSDSIPDAPPAPGPEPSEIKTIEPKRIDLSKAIQNVQLKSSQLRKLTEQNQQPSMFDNFKNVVTLSYNNEDSDSEDSDSEEWEIGDFGDNTWAEVISRPITQVSQKTLSAKASWIPLPIQSDVQFGKSNNISNGIASNCAPPPPPMVIIEDNPISEIMKLRRDSMLGKKSPKILDSEVSAPLVLADSEPYVLSRRKSGSSRKRSLSSLEDGKNLEGNRVISDQKGFESPTKKHKDGNSLDSHESIY